MPKTPLDAYDGLDAGSLGREFSVLKMKPSAYTDDEQDPDSPTTKVCRVIQPLRILSDFQLSSNPATKALPSWLATTFQGLNRDHPLRLLMPLSRRTSQQATSSDSVEENCPPELSDDEQPFAYLPPPPSIATHHDPSLVIIEDLTPAIDAAFVPFAKPGPASTLSPTWPTPVLPRIIQDVPPVRAQQPRTIFSPPAQLSLSYHDAPIQEPHSISPSYAHALPPYTLASPYHAPTSPAAMPPPSSDIPVARYSDDPPVVHANIPNIYATPGPGYLASRPAYFDSPTEPPETSSSPIPFEDWAPNADFDPTELDFRWKPFDRTNRDVESPYDSAVGISLADMDVYAPSENDYVFEDEEEMIDVDVSEYADDAFASPGPDIFVESSVAVPDDSLFRFDPPSPSLPPSSTSAQSKEEEHVPSPPPKPTSTPAPAPFMPAPGIYISPLRQPSSPVPVVADEKVSPVAPVYNLQD